MNNPFRYGTRVIGGAFSDRSSVMRAIVNTLDGVYRLAAPLLAHHLS